MATRTLFAGAMAALTGLSAVAADWYGTHVNEAGVTDWGDAENWKSATGVPEVNVDFTESVIAEKNGSKTVTFSDARVISGNLHLYAGTEEAPLVLKGSGENGLAMTASKEAYVGSGAANPAYVILDGGTYTFMNDFNIARNQSAGTLVIKEGTVVHVPYWSFISGGSGGGQSGLVVIDGGEFVGGYRDGAEHSNGRFNIAEGGSSTAKLVVKSGRFRCSNNTNNGNQSEALCIANGSSSNGTFEQLGGATQVDGFLYVGRAGSSTAVMTLKDGEVKVNGQFVLADGDNSTGTYVQDGGTLISTSYLCIGSIHNDHYTADFTLNGGEVRNTGNVVTMGSRGTAGSMATLTINGGIFSSVSDLWIGENGSATVNLNGGVADFSNGWVSLSRNGSEADEPHVLNLNGGVLKAKRVVYEKGSGPATVTFNGGTLEVTGNTEFFTKNDHLTVQVGAKGGTIDAAHNKYTLAGDIVSGVEAGETDGGLTFTGAGLTLLRGQLAYSGATTVESGVLVFNAGYTFDSPLVLGAHGALAVDISAVVAAANAAETPLVVGDEITLFTVEKGLSFADDADSLATTVFLYGKMVGYDVFMAEDGVTVKARLTDVSKITANSAVTVFCGAADGGEPSHVDQAAAFNNGTPDNGRYDLVFFTYDAILHAWSDNKNTMNNRRMGQLVVRDATVRYTISNLGFPNLDALNLCGRGTVMFTQTGCRLDNKNDGAIHVAPTVNLAFDNTGVAHGQDNWVAGDGATYPVIIDGDLYATNGILRLYGGAVINGTIHCATYDVASYVDHNEVTVNGGLVVSTGGTFDFKNKAATIGEEAKLVYDGGKVINFGSLAFPSVEVTSSVYLYTDLMKDADTVITVNGGEVTMPLDLAESYQPVVVQAGGVRFDVSAKTDLVEGSVLSLDSIELAEGVTFDDISVAIVGSAFDWNVYVDPETGSLKATAYTATSSNKWIGGPSGLYSEKGNWSHGLPTMDQTVEFTYDAVVYHDFKGDVFLEIGKLVLNGHRVSFEILNHDNQYWGSVRIGSFDANETGTLGLWRTGVWTRQGSATNIQRLDWPATMKLEVGGTNLDCWLRDDWGDQIVRCPVEILEATTTLNLDYNVSLLGGVTGPGTVTGRQKADRNDVCRLIGGDWTGFTGTYNGNKDDHTRFMSDFTGSAQARWYFPQFIRFDHAEGTVKFGKMTLTDTRHIETQQDSTLVIEVGALNEDCAFGADTRIYANATRDWQDAWTRGSSTVTVKKVGTGTLTADFDAEAHVQVAEGTLSLSSTDELLALVVDESATVTATQDVTVGSATFATGAQVRLASADAEAVPMITVKNAVDVTGVKIVPTEAVADALRAQEEGGATAYALLTSEAGLTGQPNGDVVVACEDEAYGWKAQAVGQTLQLRRKYIKPGFLIIVM